MKEIISFEFFNAIPDNFWKCRVNFLGFLSKFLVSKLLANPKFLN